MNRAELAKLHAEARESGVMDAAYRHAAGEVAKMAAIRPSGGRMNAAALDRQARDRLNRPRYRAWLVLIAAFVAVGVVW